MYDFRKIVTVALQRGSHKSRQACIEEVWKLSAGKKLIDRGLNSQTSSLSCTRSAAELVVTGDFNDLEAAATCEIVQRLLQQRLQVEVALSEETVTSKVAAYFVVVLSQHVLSNPQVAINLAHASVLGIELVPIVSDLSFTFPDDKFWQTLSEGKVIDPDDPRLSEAKVSLDDVTLVYKKLFTVLALRFTSRGSWMIQETEIREMQGRFRNLGATKGGSQVEAQLSIQEGGPKDANVSARKEEPVPQEAQLAVGEDVPKEDFDV